MLLHVEMWRCPRGLLVYPCFFVFVFCFLRDWCFLSWPQFCFPNCPRKSLWLFKPCSRSCPGTGWLGWARSRGSGTLGKRVRRPQPGESLSRTVVSTRQCTRQRCELRELSTRDLICKTISDSTKFTYTCVSIYVCMPARVSLCMCYIHVCLCACSICKWLHVCNPCMFSVCVSICACAYICLHVRTTIRVTEFIGTFLAEQQSLSPFTLTLDPHWHTSVHFLVSCLWVFLLSRGGATWLHIKTQPCPHF